MGGPRVYVSTVTDTPEQRKTVPWALVTPSPTLSTPGVVPETRDNTPSETRERTTSTTTHNDDTHPPPVAPVAPPPTKHQWTAVALCPEFQLEKLLQHHSEALTDPREELIIVVWREGATTNWRATPVEAGPGVKVVILMWNVGMDGALPASWARARALNAAISNAKASNKVVVVSCDDVTKNLASMVKTGDNNKQGRPRPFVQNTAARLDGVSADAFRAVGGYDERLAFVLPNLPEQEALLQRRLRLHRAEPTVVEAEPATSNVDYWMASLIPEAILREWPECCVGGDMEPRELQRAGVDALKRSAITKLHGSWGVPEHVTQNLFANNPATLESLRALLDRFRDSTGATPPRALTMLCVVRTGSVLERMRRAAAAIHISRVLRRLHDSSNAAQAQTAVPKVVLVLAWVPSHPWMPAAWNDLFEPLPDVVHVSSWDDALGADASSAVQVVSDAPSAVVAARDARKACLRLEPAPSVLRDVDVVDTMASSLVPVSAVKVLVAGTLSRYVVNQATALVLPPPPAPTSSPEAANENWAPFLNAMRHAWALLPRQRFYVSPFPAGSFQHAVQLGLRLNPQAGGLVFSLPVTCATMPSDVQPRAGAPPPRILPGTAMGSRLECSRAAIADLYATLTCTRLLISRNASMADYFCRLQSREPMRFTVLDVETNEPLCVLRDEAEEHQAKQREEQIGIVNAAHLSQIPVRFLEPSQMTRLNELRRAQDEREVRAAAAAAAARATR